MKHIIFILIFFSFSFFSCKTSNNVQRNTDKIIITFDKKSGRGINPTYSMKIYENGKIVYTGIKNTDKIGTFQKTFSKKEIKSLKQKFNNAGFFNFNNEYTSKITDLPTTYISYSYKGKYKKIRDYYGSPQKLKELEKTIENIVNENDWKKVE